jgi:hypothetical protein
LNVTPLANVAVVIVSSCSSWLGFNVEKTNKKQDNAKLF